MVSNSNKNTEDVIIGRHFIIYIMYGCLDKVMMVWTLECKRMPTTFNLPDVHSIYHTISKIIGCFHTTVCISDTGKSSAKITNQHKAIIEMLFSLCIQNYLFLFSFQKTYIFLSINQFSK